MKKNLFFRFVTFYSVASILLQSLLPFFYVFPRSSFAQEVTPTAAVTPTSEPTATPTQEPTVVPTSAPTATPTISPTEEPKPTSAITPTLSPTAVPSAWTFEKVELNKEYVAPQNSGVKLTFTKLPNPSGNIKIEEITLTAEQIKQTGSLSDKAYDITSDMKDGEFTYNLSLPIPESSKGKEVNVKFAEELSTISSAKEVENNLSSTDSSVSVRSLNHFTIFVVTNNIPASTVQVSKLEPNWTADGGGGVWSSYAGPAAYSMISPGSTAIFDSREAGIIKAGINIDGDGHYWDDGIFGFKPTGTINDFASGDVSYDVNNQEGTNPVWMTIEIDTGEVSNRNDDDVYQFVPTTNPAGWHTVDATAGLWQKWTSHTSGTADGPQLTLGEVATNNLGLNITRAYLRLGMGDSYHGTGAGTVAWVDKATLGGVTYDFVIDNTCSFASIPAPAGTTACYETLQAAIAAATDGETINVAPGTYVEVGQIVINKSLTIIGADKATTIIKPAQDTSDSGDSRGWFLVNSGVTFNLSKVTLDGEGHKTREAIRNHGNGLIDDCNIKNIKYGTYLGTGVNVVGTENVDIKNSYFSLIERVGVLFTNTATGVISGNTYTGKGTGDWLDYAFDIQYGAHVTIDNNFISNNRGVASDTSDSSAISIWDDSGTQATITNNTFTNNHIGVAIAISGWGGLTDPTVSIGNGNVFNSGDIGVDLENAGSSGNPSVTFGASTFKGFNGPTTQAIKIQDGIGENQTYNISNVIFKDSSNVDIIAGIEIEKLVYHHADAPIPNTRGTLKWDYTNPALSITSPTLNQNLNGRTISISGTATDNYFNYYYCYVSNVSGHEYGTRDASCNTTWHSVSPAGLLGSVTLPNDLPDGNYVVHLIGKDKVGNSTEVTKQFILDNTAPLKPVGLTRFTPDNSKEYSCGAISQRQTLIPTWTANGESDLNHYEYTSFNSDGSIGLNEQQLTTNEFVHTWVPISDGTFGYAVRAVDNAGNKSDWALSAESLAGSCQITYDSTLPSIPHLTSPIAGVATNDNTPLMQWDDSTDTGGTGIAGYYYRVYYNCSNSNDSSTCTAVYPNSTGLWLVPSQYQTGATNNGTYYWQVRSKDNAGNQSNWSSLEKVTIDTIPPVITINSYNTSWTNGDVIVTASTNEGTLNTTTHTFTANGPFDFVATDSAGNSSTTTVTISNIDKVDPSDPGTPVPSITSSPTNQTTITWSWTVAADALSGIKNYLWNLFKGADNKTSGTTTDTYASVDLLSYGDGGYTFDVQSEDNAGNVSGVKTSSSTVIDTAKPTVSSVDSDGATYNLASSNPIITVTFNEDISNTPSIEIFSPVGTPQTVGNCSDTDARTFCFTYSLADEEVTHTIAINGAQDLAGNTMNTNSSHTFIVDRVVPYVSDKTPFSGWYNTNKTATFTYSDTNGIASGNDPTCDITTEGTGQTCSVIPNVCDTNGNCNTTSVTSNGADIDKTNPHSTITAPSNSGSGTTIYTNDWTGSILGTASDSTSGVNGVQVSIQKGTTQYFDGTDFVDSATEILRPATYTAGEWEYSELTAPLEGSYTIKSHAIDNATNMESTYTLTIIFDKTIPEVTISLNPVVADASNGWYKTQPEVTLTATDAHIDRIDYSWDSATGPWTVYTVPFKPSTEGARVLYYRAHDLADNYSDTGIKNIKWNKTDLKEGPLNVNVSPNPTSESTSKVKWDAATSETIGIDKYEVKWSLKSGSTSYTASVGSGVREYTVDNLTEGVWEVKVTAFDASGNSKSASADLTVDRTGPNVPSLSIFGTGPGSVSLSWSKIDGANNYIIWYGTNPGSYQYGAKVGDTQSYTVQGLGAGSYYFIVKAVDPSGNQSGNSNEVSTGAIAGAPGVAENAPAQGFAEEVLGTNTLTPTPAPTGSVLGTKDGKNKLPWWSWLFLLLLPTGWFGYKEWRKKRSIVV